MEVLQVLGADHEFAQASCAARKRGIVTYEPFERARKATRCSVNDGPKRVAGIALSNRARRCHREWLRSTMDRPCTNSASNRAVLQDLLVIRCVLAGARLLLALKACCHRDECLLSRPDEAWNATDGHRSIHVQGTGGAVVSSRQVVP